MSCHDVIPDDDVGDWDWLKWLAGNDWEELKDKKED